MSLSSLLTDAEADVAKANPVAIIKAALLDIEALKADVVTLKSDAQVVKAVLVAAQPALTTLMSFVFPGGAGIPAEIVALLGALPEPSIPGDPNPAKA